MTRIRRSPLWVSLAIALVIFGGMRGGARATDTPDSELDTLQQRVKPCTSCHGNEGRATREGYFPRIAGKPSGYLFNQLLNFREGRRHYPMMTYVTQYQSDDYLREIAGYFGSQHVPYPPPMQTTVAAAVLTRGRQLVTEGDKTLDIPACTSCHGQRLLGVIPAVPGLLGVSQDYLTAQLGAWRSGVRAATAPDCMGELVRRMRNEDLDAATAWLASQAVPEGQEPEGSFEHSPPLHCGSIEQGTRAP